MVKEVSVPMDSSMITLANGVSQAIVASKRTGVQPTISFTSYEFTAQTVMRSLAMNDTAAVLKRGALTAALVGAAKARSEECSVGTECVSTCRYRWSTYP